MTGPKSREEARTYKYGSNWGSAQCRNPAGEDGLCGVHRRARNKGAGE